jgi:hypothetical protein
MPTGDEQRASVAAGIMFAEPRRMDHNGWVRTARAAADAVRLSDIGQAFIGSLTTRRLDLRSALGSFAVARHLPLHDFSIGPSWLCRVCGLREEDEQDLNVLSFERFKWGGVRKADLRYVTFDLEQFLRAPTSMVDATAIAIGRQLITKLRTAPFSETATTATAKIRMIKGNAAERATLLDSLGLAGILAPQAHPGYLHTFVPFDQRMLPPRHFVDRAYPVCWWRGSDGVNEEAVQTFLPDLT